MLSHGFISVALALNLTFPKVPPKPHLLRCKIDKMIKTLPRNNHKNGLTFLSRCEEIESIV